MLKWIENRKARHSKVSIQGLNRNFQAFNDRNIMTAETIQILANIATAATFGLFAWQLWKTNIQTKKSAIQKRSEYIIDLYNTFIDDEEMVKIYYAIEYDEFKYNPSKKFSTYDFMYDENFHGSSLEKQLDKLLGHFSNIGRLYCSDILTREDLNFLKYEFLIIYQNDNVKSYLTFLDNWFNVRKIKDKKFDYFRKTGQLLEKENNK